MNILSVYSSKNMKGVVFKCLNAHFSFQKNSGSTVQKQKKWVCNNKEPVILFQDCPCLPQNLRFNSLCLEMLYLNGCFDITLFMFNIPWSSASPFTSHWVLTFIHKRWNIIAFGEQICAFALFECKKINHGLRNLRYRHYLNHQR